MKYLVIFSLVILEVGIKRALFPDSSPLWMMPAGFVTGWVVSHMMGDN
jgi:hypothetical protein